MMTIKAAISLPWIRRPRALSGHHVVCKVAFKPLIPMHRIDVGLREILVRFRAALRRTTEAPPRRWSRRGRIPEHVKSPELSKVPLCLRAIASPFWIILLLVWANPEHLEPLTLNQRVPGSSPGAPTI